ncbi:hypothetical protein LHO31_002658 [Vibrio alginolyticus]|nr:hypothetical protein [Vibrio alginolyticus]EII5415343.1 hypothetical protein [Vibrio alginolyticus]
MVKNIKVTNKYAIKLERAKIRHFALANRWILVIIRVASFDASEYSEHHDAEMVKLVDTLA